MGVYIPEKLYTDISNEAAVHMIIGKYFKSDVHLDPSIDEFEECRKELQRLNETKIADALENLITVG